VSITVIVENDTIKLPVHVPDGTRLELTLPEVGASGDEAGGALAWMAEFAGAIKTLPPDFAERHDHYIHGRKRQLG
jgi:hypothetical protein